MKFFNEITKKMAAAGCEEEIRSYIKSCFSGFEFFTDSHGSLIAHKKGKGEGKMIVTTLDIPSLFVTHVEKNGFARFCSNGIDKEILRGARVRFCDGTRGVVYSGKDAEITDMYIDAGGKKDILEAEPVMIDAAAEKMGNMLTGFCIGNYACMRSVIDAANMVENVNLYVVFLAKSVKRKPSCGFLNNIDNISEIYCIEKSKASDTPDEDNHIINVGGGACVRVMDKSMIASKRLLDKAMTFSKKVKIQREVSDSISATAVLHTAYEGFESICFGIPTRYAGQLCESVSPSDIGELTELIIKNLEV